MATPDEYETDPDMPDDPDRAPRGRREDDGLPPDEGPELPVMTIRPSWWRGKPLALLSQIVLLIALTVGVHLVFKNWTATWIVLGVSALAIVAWCVWRWVAITLSMSLRVTNKRIIERRGLFSRSSDEVVLDHIRNVRVDQSLKDRIFGVGRVGISSSGQDGIEIEMDDIPRPEELRNVLDKYRSLG